MPTRTPRWPILLAFSALLLAALACGGFQVRVTPTAVVPTETTQPMVEPTETPAPAALTAAPTPVPPTAAPTATPTQAPTSMTVGGQARVAAGGGLNVREQPSARGRQVGRLNTNAIVTLVEGPTQADNYDWWKVDNGAGLVGWVAAGPANEPWLVPSAAETSGPPATTGPRLVDRPIKLGDNVQVTTDPAQVLTVRDYAGTNTTPVARVIRGTLFTVRGGPIKQDGLTWWELEGETVRGWAAEGDGQNRWLTPVE